MRKKRSILLAFLRRLGLWWMALMTVTAPVFYHLMTSEETITAFTREFWEVCAFFWAVSAFMSLPVALFCTALHTTRSLLAGRRPRRKASTVEAVT